MKGGDLSQVDKDELRVASWKLVERAGHTRISIGASYYGSRRRDKRTAVLIESKEEKNVKNLSEVEEMMA